MAKKLSKIKRDKYNKILSVDTEFKSGKLSRKEKLELKSFKIQKAVKLKTYVRD